MDTDPDRQVVDTDPDPAKMPIRSDPDPQHWLLLYP